MAFGLLVIAVLTTSEFTIYPSIRTLVENGTMLVLLNRSSDKVPVYIEDLQPSLKEVASLGVSRFELCGEFKIPIPEEFEFEESKESCIVREKAGPGRIILALSLSPIALLTERASTLAKQPEEAKQDTPYLLEMRTYLSQSPHHALLKTLKTNPDSVRLFRNTRDNAFDFSFILLKKAFAYADQISLYELDDAKIFEVKSQKYNSYWVFGPKGKQFVLAVEKEPVSNANFFIQKILAEPLQGVAGSLGQFPEIAPSIVTVPRAEIDIALSKLSFVLSQARAVPFFSNGKPVGYQITIDPESIYGHLGFKNNDVIYFVSDQQGRKYDYSKSPIELLTALKQKSEFTVRIKRGESIFDQQIKFTDPTLKH